MTMSETNPEMTPDEQEQAPAGPPVGSVARYPVRDGYSDPPRDRVLRVLVIESYSYTDEKTGETVTRVQGLPLGYEDEALDVPVSELAR